jgi:hypothetical protein
MGALARAVTALGVVLAFAARAIAQTAPPADDQKQFWPELDLYQGLSPHSRLFGEALYTLGANDLSDHAQYDVDLDLFLKPRDLLADLRRGARSLVEERTEGLQLRVGYQYAQSIQAAGGYVQNLILAEATIRRTAWGILAADRNGFDWRWTNGEWSTRYRNRLQLQRSFRVRDYEITPYVNAQIYYTITSSEWSGVGYEAGVQFPVLRRFTVEPYFALQNSWGGSPSSTLAFGLKLVLSN